MLERLWQFAEEEELGETQTDALEEALLAMSNRMDELRPGDGARLEGPPSDEAQDAARQERRAVMDSLDAEVQEILGEELADAFHEEMRPPGRRRP